MFLLAFCANVLYGVSIIMSDIDWASVAFWENQFPYIFGSVFNIWAAVILVQYFMYKNKNKKGDLIESSP